MELNLGDGRMLTGLCNTRRESELSTDCHSPELRLTLRRRWLAVMVVI